MKQLTLTTHRLEGKYWTNGAYYYTHETIHINSKGTCYTSFYGNGGDLIMEISRDEFDKRLAHMQAGNGTLHPTYHCKLTFTSRTYDIPNHSQYAE